MSDKLVINGALDCIEIASSPADFSIKDKWEAARWGIRAEYELFENNDRFEDPGTGVIVYKEDLISNIGVIIRSINEDLDELMKGECD